MKENIQIDPYQSESSGNPSLWCSWQSFHVPFRDTPIQHLRSWQRPVCTVGQPLVELGMGKAAALRSKKMTNSNYFEIVSMKLVPNF